jgi:hypothetical protein
MREIKAQELASLNQLLVEMGIPNIISGGT